MRALTHARPASAAALVVAAALAAYAGTIGHAFTWDDAYNVVENPAIRDLANVPRFFVEPWGAQAEDPMSRAINTNYWRPVALTSYAVDHALFGLSPAAFHATNVALHALASALVLLLGLRLFPAPGPERAGVLAGAVLFAVHPVHTEVVDVITYRTDLLAGLFLLACLAAWLPPPGGRSPARERLAVYVAAPLLYALGVASKEMAVTAPALVALLDLAVPPRPLPLRDRALRLAPMLAVLAGYLALRAALLSPSPYSFFGDTPGPTVLFTMLGVFGLYARLIVAPWPLNPFYDWSAIPPEPHLLAPRPLLGLGLLLAWVALTAVAWRRDRRVAFLLALWLVILAPVSQVVPVVVAAAERFLYVAVAGPLLAAGVVLARLATDVRRRAALAALAALTGAAFLGLTVARNADWRDDRAILEALVRDWPTSYNGWYGLARLHEREGRVAEACAIHARLDRPEDLARLRCLPSDAPVVTPRSSPADAPDGDLPGGPP